MVIVRLLGGLGNQLFQYAMARRIAWQHQVPLKMDISSFDCYKLRSYRLNHFNIAEDFATKQEIYDLVRAGKIVRERQFCFDEQMMNISGDVYIDGYWQCERYFKNISDLVRREFQLRTRLNQMDEDIVKKIKETQSISLHIRRGDYVYDEYNHQIHGTCSLAYYHSCVEKIMESIDRPHFFLFSDDKEWVQENIKLSGPVTFVTHNDIDREYADLYLMSNCKHHIIANSSFSWWGAWLCSNERKRVFAPARWFHSNDYDSKDIIPSEWSQVEG